MTYPHTDILIFIIICYYLCNKIIYYNIRSYTVVCRNSLNLTGLKLSQVISHVKCK